MSPSDRLTDALILIPITYILHWPCILDGWMDRQTVGYELFWDGPGNLRFHQIFNGLLYVKVKGPKATWDYGLLGAWRNLQDNLLITWITVISHGIMAGNISC